MTHSKVKKHMKRYIKKRLYQFFSALNNLNLSLIKPVLLSCLGVLFIVIGCFLPTKASVSKLNATDVQTQLASCVRHTIRSSASEDKSSIDVVALFLPKEYSGFSKDESQDYLKSAELYSIYLTGTELSYLAEMTVSMKSSLLNTTLTLDGLSYSYHPLRLPLNRITELTFSDSREVNATQLYRVVSTEEIFTLFHYVSYRSQHLMQIEPKDCNGVELSDYEMQLLSSTYEPLTLADASMLSSSVATKMTDCATNTTVAASVTRLSGLNLITLCKHPNQTTLYFVLLTIMFTLLLWYSIPRIKRVRLWVRIHAIRRRKRANHPIVFRSYRRFGSNASGISKRHVA